MSSWSDVSLETSACLLLAVAAYKLYRMRISARSECCGGGMNVKLSNPGDRTPTFLRRHFPGDKEEREEEEGKGRERDIEAGFNGAIKKSKLIRMTNEAVA